MAGQRHSWKQFMYPAPKYTPALQAKYGPTVTAVKPRYFELEVPAISKEDRIPLDSVIYYQLFRTRLFRIPRYFELIVLSLHLKSTPLFRTCQKQSTYIRAQLETYCILFELEQNIQRFFNATASADLSDI